MDPRAAPMPVWVCDFVLTCAKPLAAAQVGELMPRAFQTEASELKRCPYCRGEFVAALLMPDGSLVREIPEEEADAG